MKLANYLRISYDTALNQSTLDIRHIQQQDIEEFCAFFDCTYRWGKRIGTVLILLKEGRQVNHELVMKLHLQPNRRYYAKEDFHWQGAYFLKGETYTAFYLDKRDHYILRAENQDIELDEVLSLHSALVEIEVPQWRKWQKEAEEYFQQAITSEGGSQV